MNGLAWVEMSAFKFEGRTAFIPTDLYEQSLSIIGRLGTIIPYGDSETTFLPFLSRWPRYSAGYVYVILGRVTTTTRMNPLAATVRYAFTRIYFSFSGTFRASGFL